MRGVGIITSLCRVREGATDFLGGMSASGSRSALDWSSAVMWPFPKRSFHDSWKPSGSGASFLGWNYRNKRDFCSSHHLQRNPGLAWATRGVPQGKDRFKVFDLFMLGEASGHRRAYGGDGFFSTVSLPPPLPSLFPSPLFLPLSRSHTQTLRVCACLCARARVLKPHRQLQCQITARLLVIS